MSVSTVADIVFSGEGLTPGGGYVVCTTTRTYAPVCSKCVPVWQPPFDERPLDTHAEAREVLEEHDKMCHRPGPGA